MHDNGTSSNTNNTPTTTNNTDSSNNVKARSTEADPNPFVRFKQHVDANIQAGINTLTGGSGLSRSRTTTATSPGSGMSGNTSDSSSSLTEAANLGLLTPQEARFESRLSSLTDSASSSGFTVPEASSAWRLFLLRSAYSPLRLEYDHDWSSTAYPSSSLPPTPSVFSPRGLFTSPWKHVPVPRDLPAGCEPGEVGWLEAFEDLLRVNSGMELMDLRERVRENRRVWNQLGFEPHVFGSLFGSGANGDLDRWRGWDSSWAEEEGWLGNPRHYHPHGSPFGPGSGPFGRNLWSFFLPGDGMRADLWMRRMQAQGLHEVLFPVNDTVFGRQSPRTIQEWTERRRNEQERRRKAESLWDAVMEDVRKNDSTISTSTSSNSIKEVDADDQPRSHKDALEDARRKLDAWWDAGHDTATSFLDGVGGFVRALGKVLEEEARSLQQFGKGHDHKKNPDKKNDGPETESDLYTLIHNTFQESERSLSNLFKSLSESWHNTFDTTKEAKPASPPKTETTESFDPKTGLTEKTTKTDFVDKLGNTHTKTETVWTDESGRVVMRQVHSSVGRKGRWEWKFGGDAAAGESREDDGELKEQQQQQKQLEGGTSAEADEGKNKKKEKEGGWFWK
ncbi:hypothetical protein VTJ04DRAFT_331 [Mycothermus thermophilus]|uniref:uncharacterized protein n=1 Tax=Humicola insolens TaxID=85995 RepID=UPI003743479C